MKMGMLMFMLRQEAKIRSVPSQAGRRTLGRMNSYQIAPVSWTQDGLLPRGPGRGGHLLPCLVHQQLWQIPLLPL